MQQYTTLGTTQQEAASSCMNKLTVIYGNVQFI